MNSSPAPQPARKVRSASKTTAAYWASRIRLEKKTGWESSNYFVRMQARGVRRKMKLNSTIREEAAREAAALYLDILSNGWPREDGAMVIPPSCDLPSNPSIQEWHDAVRLKSLVAGSTLDKYFESLQTIVGEILGMPRARKKEQRAKIRSFRVADLGKTALKNWLEARVGAARKLDVVASRRALNTARSLVINARSLFSKDILEAVAMPAEELPHVPFSGMKLPSKGQERYTSRIDPRKILAAARCELGDAADGDPGSAARFEQWKILYLALVAGLRYKEIDRLRVQDVMPDACRISIGHHETFSPKTEASVGDVPVNSEAAAVLKGMLERTKGEWFVGDAPMAGSKYRAARHHHALIRWLRSYGERGVMPLAKVAKPLHELRKEAGSLVNHEHGLVAAQHFLRHRSITTTAGVYVEAKGKVNTGLS